MRITERRNFFGRMLAGSFMLTPLAAALSGCSKSGWPEGMVEIKWDRETCPRCSMVISDRRFAAELRGGPKDTAIKFDDIGCMTFWIRDKLKDMPWLADAATRMWVADSNSKGKEVTWLDPRKAQFITAKLDIVESLRARWFQIYTLVFGGIVALLFLFGLTESRVLGFIGLSRLLVTYIQLTMAILPIFVLITTVRSVAGDREAGVFEYLLSLPVSLSAWFWGKIVGRYIVVFAPVFLAMLGAVGWATIQGIEVPWEMFSYYTALLAVMAMCFLGIGMLISAVARTTDMAQGAAFLVWLTFLLFLDLILLGVMIQGKVAPEFAVTLALANPLQVFRTAALALFDPQLIVLGPSAYVILDLFGTTGYKIFALVYPAALGIISATTGYFLFRRGDLP
jgi:ABC-2 type transport system permease protein